METNTGVEAWDTLLIRPGIYNILTFRNGVDTLFVNDLIPGGEIKKIRMTLGTRNSVVRSGISSPLIITGNNRQVEMNVDDIDRILANSFQLWIDFDGHGSVIKLNNNQYELRPNIHTFNNNNTGKIKGEIKPSGALPAMVLVIAGQDTLRAITENNGEFKVRGIRTNAITLVIKASLPYKDSVMNNISIPAGNERDLKDILLHR